MKLTNAQRENLVLIEAGSVYRATHGYGAQRIYGGQPSVVGRLISLGLAEWENKWGDGHARLTTAGRAALEDGK